MKTYQTKTKNTLISKRFQTFPEWTQGVQKPASCQGINKLKGYHYHGIHFISPQTQRRSKSRSSPPAPTSRSCLRSWKGWVPSRLRFQRRPRRYCKHRQWTSLEEDGQTLSSTVTLEDLNLTRWQMRKTLGTMCPKIAPNSNRNRCCEQEINFSTHP